MKKTILVVEDEKPLSSAIDKSLTKKGFRVLSANSVERGLVHLKKEKISAIWLDHYLVGEASGLDLVVMLKDNKSKWKDIPVFVVSNTASPDKVKYYLELGVDRYYTKSDVRLDFLVSEIEKIIK